MTRVRENTSSIGKEPSYSDIIINGYNFSLKLITNS